MTFNSPSPFPSPSHVIKFIISGFSIIGMEAEGLKWRVSHMCLEKIKIIAIRSKEKTDTLSVYQTLASNKGPEVLRLHFLIFLNLFNLNGALLDVIHWMQTCLKKSKQRNKGRSEWRFPLLLYSFPPVKDNSVSNKFFSLLYKSSFEKKLIAKWVFIYLITIWLTFSSKYKYT